MIRKNKACCFTGHRYISTEFKEKLPEKIELQIRELISNGTVDFVTGGARGFDTLVALEVIKLRLEFPEIRLILALPCHDQTRGWTNSDKNLYEKILNSADLIYYTAENYSSDCMMKRNQFMVDNSVSCVFYLTNPRSGTYKTVAYAMENDLELYNILSIK